MLVSALEGHRIWADCYDVGCNPLLALETRLMRDVFSAVIARNVLDVACGTCRWAAWFAGRGASVLGVDLCAEMLAQAPARLHGRFALGRAEALPVAANTADLTLCSFAASYFPALETAISEMARVTRHDGYLVISDVHPAAVAAGWTRSFRARDRVYEMEHFGYTPDNLQSAAQRAGLDFETAVYGCFDEPERPAFAAAGRPERFAQVTGVPAVWIGKWRKA